mmetsp:Transcript_129204/g.359796  ORF Transcript_129204/g.359796 Transcript_129204/m.359796 type:complete len:353 (+) Transcript_129204:636-1694(+)
MAAARATHLQDGVHRQEARAPGYRGAFRAAPAAGQEEPQVYTGGIRPGPRAEAHRQCPRAARADAPGIARLLDQGCPQALAGLRRDARRVVLARGPRPLQLGRQPAARGGGARPPHSGGCLLASRIAATHQHQDLRPGLAEGRDQAGHPVQRAVHLGRAPALRQPGRRRGRGRHVAGVQRAQRRGHCELRYRVQVAPGDHEVLLRRARQRDQLGLGEDHGRGPQRGLGCRGRPALPSQPEPRGKPGARGHETAPPLAAACGRKDLLPRLPDLLSHDRPHVSGPRQRARPPRANLPDEGGLSPVAPLDERAEASPSPTVPLEAEVSGEGPPRRHVRLLWLRGAESAQATRLTF